MKDVGYLVVMCLATGFVVLLGWLIIDAMLSQWTRGGWIKDDIVREHECKLPNKHFHTTGSRWSCYGCGKKWKLIRVVTAYGHISAKEWVVYGE